MDEVTRLWAGGCCYARSLLLRWQWWGGWEGLRGGLRAQSTSLKANMSHLEACAAAGLASLVVSALGAGLMALNAQLRRSSKSNNCGEWRVFWGVSAGGGIVLLGSMRFL